MTTIAFKNNVIASDGQVTTNGLIETQKYTKIFKVPKGYLAFCGDAADGLDLVDHYKSKDGGNICLKELSINGILISTRTKKCYKLWVSSGGRLHEVEIEGFWAIGSGAEIALGAMAAGASAAEAVCIAIQYDAYSGGEVVEVSI